MKKVNWKGLSKKLNARRKKATKMFGLGGQVGGTVFTRRKRGKR